MPKRFRGERLTADVDQGLDGEIGMPAAEVAQLRRPFRPAAGISRSALPECHGSRFFLWGSTDSLENKAFARFCRYRYFHIIEKKPFFRRETGYEALEKQARNKGSSSAFRWRAPPQDRQRAISNTIEQKENIIKGFDVGQRFRREAMTDLRNGQPIRDQAAPSGTDKTGKIRAGRGRAVRGKK